MHETIRAFLLRTTALYSGVIKAPTPPQRTETVTVWRKQGKKSVPVQVEILV